MIPFFMLLVITLTFTASNMSAMGKKKAQLDEFASSDDEKNTTIDSTENSPTRLGNRLKYKATRYKKLYTELQTALRRCESIHLQPTSPTKEGKLQQVNDQIENLKLRLNSLGIEN